jgi:TonB family protein
MPIELDKNRETRRLALALTLSALLHASPVILGWLHAESPDEQGRQITLQVSIQPSPPAPAARPHETPQRGPDKKKDKAPPRKQKKDAAEHGNQKLLTSKGSEKLPLQSGQPEEREKPEEAQQEVQNADAVAIEDPGAPAYPPEAIKRGLESCVLTAVYVSAAGEVEKVRILHADVAGVFDQSIIDAQNAAHYLPARRNGENIPSRVLAVAAFVLQAEQSRNCAFKYAAAARTINALPYAAEISPSLVESMLAK